MHFFKIIHLFYLIDNVFWWFLKVRGLVIENKNRQNLKKRSSAYGTDRLPRQDDFRTFCMSDETEKVYQKLEEMIGVCEELKNNKKGRIFN